MNICIFCNLHKKRAIIDFREPHQNSLTIWERLLISISHLSSVYRLEVHYFRAFLIDLQIVSLKLVPLCGKKRAALPLNNGRSRCSFSFLLFLMNLVKQVRPCFHRQHFMKIIMATPLIAPYGLLVLVEEWRANAITNSNRWLTKRGPFYLAETCLN